MDLVLLFRLGEERYALEVSHIQEVVESPRYHFIPRAPETFQGAVNFHGSIVPVLDLVAFLGLDGDQRDPRIIVLTAALCPLALAVTAVQRIVELDPETFLPQQERPERCVRSVFSHEDEKINLLDAGRLLASLEKTGKITGGDDGA